MPTVEERLASLESKVEAIAELRTMILDLRQDVRTTSVELRQDIRAMILELRQEMISRFEQVDRRFEQVDKRFEQVDDRLDRLDHRNVRLEDREDRHFLWLLGIQMSILIVVLAAMLAFVTRA